MSEKIRLEIWHREIWRRGYSAMTLGTIAIAL
jgi:hypothetical protein